MAARGLARQAVWNQLALLVQLTAALGVTAIAFRELPAADVGIYALAMATIGLLIVIDPSVGYRVTTEISEAVAAPWRAHQARTAVDDIQTGLTTLSALLGVVGAVGSSVAWFVVPADDRPVVVMAALLVGALCLQFLTAAYPAITAGRGDFRDIAMSGLLFGSSMFAVVWLTIPHQGIVSLGLGQLAGQSASRAYLWFRLRHSERPALLRRLRPAALHTLLLVAGPMTLAGVAGQMLPFADLWLVGSFVGTAAVASYRAGTILPMQGLSLLYRLYDVVFPRFSRLGDEAAQVRAVRLVTRTFCAFGGATLAGGALLASDLVELLIGREDDLATSVMVIFCAVWAVNIPVHGVTLLAIARRGQHLLTKVVLIEAAINVILTAVLVPTVGAIGAAWATLITITASNLGFLPARLRQVVPEAMALTADGARSAILGAAVALAVTWPVTHATSGLLSVLVAGAVAAVAGAAVAAALIGSRGRATLVESARSEAGSTS